MSTNNLNQKLKGHDLILFDYECNFCNYWVQFIIKRDKSSVYMFTPLQSKWAQILDIGQNLDTVVLYRNNKIYKKSEAVLKIARNLGIFYKGCSTILSLLPKILRDYGYDLVARNRTKLMKTKDVCSLDNRAKQNRFLEDS